MHVAVWWTTGILQTLMQESVPSHPSRGQELVAFVIVQHLYLATSELV